MEKPKNVKLLLLILAGLSSGISKIMQLPREMEIFPGEMGFGANTTVF